MATPVRTPMASARGADGMHKCWGNPRHWFAATTPAGRVVDASTTRCVDFYGHIRLWPRLYAHDWPVKAARLGCTNDGGTLDIGLHPPRLLVASWTHALPVVWKSMATCFHGRPSTRTNGQCTRRGWDALMLGDPRHWFAPTTPAGRVVKARTTRRGEVYGHMFSWPPQDAHEWPVHAAQL